MLGLARTVVEAQQRLNAVADALQQKLYRSQDIGEQRKDGQSVVSAVADALPVGEDDDDRRNQRLTKGGDADADDVFRRCQESFRLSSEKMFRLLRNR